MVEKREGLLAELKADVMVVYLVVKLADVLVALMVV